MSENENESDRELQDDIRERLVRQKDEVADGERGRSLDDVVEEMEKEAWNEQVSEN